MTWSSTHLPKMSYPLDSELLSRSEKENISTVYSTELEVTIDFVFPPLYPMPAPSLPPPRWTPGLMNPPLSKE